MDYFCFEIEKIYSSTMLSVNKTDKEEDFGKTYSIIRIQTDSTISVWQENIASQIGEWLGEDVV